MQPQKTESHWLFDTKLLNDVNHMIQYVPTHKYCYLVYKTISKIICKT